jgi:hypothetical protein
VSALRRDRVDASASVRASTETPRAVQRVQAAQRGGRLVLRVLRLD